MTLNLENIAITGRTFEEYSAFFDLKLEDLKDKKVLDCPSGASSFVSTANKNGSVVTGVDLIYELDKKCEIVKVDFEFQPKANYYLKILKSQLIIRTLNQKIIYF